MDENKPKILIVDDNDIVRETYAQIFKKNNFTVLEGKDGLEGLDIATKELPDVIMTGIVMPRMDGFRLIEMLRENVSTGSIPVVIISHLGREEDKRRALELKIDNFIIQGSMPPYEIMTRIKNLLRQGHDYLLHFDAHAWDAGKLLAHLKRKDFNCDKCGRELLLKIVARENSDDLEARLYCVTCGS